MSIQEQLSGFNKLIGKKYQRFDDEPYKISSFNVSESDQKIYVALHPTSPNRRMLNISVEAHWFFDNYRPI